MSNTLLNPWNKNYTETPTFNVDINDFESAFDFAMNQSKEIINEIISNQETPTFDNTVLKLEYSSELLDNISNVFSTLSSCLNSEQLKTIQHKIYPKLSLFISEIFQNTCLYNKINYIKCNYNLPEDQSRVLDKYLKSFESNGVTLADEDKKRFADVDQQLNTVQLNFAHNVLSEEQKYIILHDDELSGLSKSFIDDLKSETKNKSICNPDIYCVPNTRSYVDTFLKYSDNREKRKLVFDMFNSRCMNNNSLNNDKNIESIQSLRLEKVKLLSELPPTKVGGF
jgi:peptidyl-dipeptidase Dcp